MVFFIGLVVNGRKLWDNYPYDVLENALPDKEVFLLYIFLFAGRWERYRESKKQKAESLKHKAKEGSVTVTVIAVCAGHNHVRGRGCSMFIGKFLPLKSSAATIDSSFHSLLNASIGLAVAARIV
jgi:hypothetical protein